MGLEIGYKVFDKKLFPIKIDDNEQNFVCGRCDVTHSWYNRAFDANYSDDNDKFVEVVVFNPEYDGHYSYYDNNDEYCMRMHYVPFKDFEKKVKYAIDEAFKNHADYIAEVKDLAHEKFVAIDEYRNLQLKAKTTAAFDGYQKLIEEAASCLAEYTNALKTYDEDDYEYTHAKIIKEMLENIKKHLDNGEVVIAYYSD